MNPTRAKFVMAALLMGAAICLPESTFAADQQIPEKYGKLTMRMSLNDAKAAAPEMTVQEASAATNNGVEPPFAFAIGKMKDLPYETFHCEASLMFFQNQLFNIEFRCPNPTEVKAYLDKTLGAPLVVGDDGVTEWKQGDRSVNFNAKAGTMNLLDNTANSAFQTMLFTYASSQTAPGTPTPKVPPTPPAAH